MTPAHAAPLRGARPVRPFQLARQPSPRRSHRPLAPPRASFLDRLLYGDKGKAQQGDAAGPAAPGPQTKRGGGPDGAANAHTDYVVVGGGLAAAAIAAALAAKGFARDRLCIVTDEAGVPYDRPSLSKPPWLSPGCTAPPPPARTPQGVPQDEAWYETAGVEFVRGRAKAIEVAKRWVVLEDGGFVSYRKLFVATGARPPPLPPCRDASRDAASRDAASRDGAPPSGAHVPYSATAAAAARASLQALSDAGGGAVAVLGDGPWALELSASAAAYPGLSVFLLSESQTLLPGYGLPPAAAQFYVDAWARGGVAARLGPSAATTCLTSTGGVLTGVCTAGGDVIACALILGAGEATPAGDVAGGSGLDRVMGGAGVGALSATPRLRCTVGGVLEATVWAAGDVLAAPPGGMGAAHAAASAAHAVASMLDPAGTAPFRWVPRASLAAFGDASSSRRDGSYPVALAVVGGAAAAAAAGAEAVAVGFGGPGDTGLVAWIHGGRLAAIAVETGGEGVTDSSPDSSPGSSLDSSPGSSPRGPLAAAAASGGLEALVAANVKVSADALRSAGSPGAALEVLMRAMGS